jgi:hypothetical protein
LQMKAPRGFRESTREQTPPFKHTGGWVLEARTKESEHTHTKGVRKRGKLTRLC